MAGDREPGALVDWSPRAPGIVLGWLAGLGSRRADLLPVRWLGRRRGFGSDVLDALRDFGILLAATPLALGVAASVLTLDAYSTAVSAFLLFDPDPLCAGRDGPLGLADLCRGPGRGRRGVCHPVPARTWAPGPYVHRPGRPRQSPGHHLLGHRAELATARGDVPALTRPSGHLSPGVAGGEWREVFVVPVRNAGMMLAVVAVSFEWGAAGPLLLAGVPFLLLIKSLPGAGWLYPALVLAGLSGMFTVLDHGGLPDSCPGRSRRRLPPGDWG